MTEADLDMIATIQPLSDKAMHKVLSLQDEIKVYRTALHRIIDSGSNVTTKEYEAPRYIAKDALREGVKYRNQ